MSKLISTEEFDRRFDDGEDMTPYLDLSAGKRGGRSIKRVNIDLTATMTDDLDAEAHRIGVTHQALIKIWLDERLTQQRQANLQKELQDA